MNYLKNLEQISKEHLTEIFIIQENNTSSTPMF